ncbi:MAG: hypothetical protein K9W43_11765 [Candidatus Thorarchaeota archaeon]|nr:hypothetical protein [Candidatus Thorarchaeota archaeon]
MFQIVNIVRVEFETLGPQLRMVILTDFIRRQFLPNNQNELTPLNKIGVIPIFEIIRRANIKGLQIGVLSGSIVILPKNAADSLRKYALAIGIDPSKLILRPLSFSSNYIEVKLVGSYKDKIVHLITELFNNGIVQVIVGTKSLLGEGWDAPSINSLVIASFVGSYMLSNQMRGRAIRTQHGNPTKTANIWHLVCVETNQDYPSDDYELMVRRFRAFVGINFTKPIIENGFERLEIPLPPFNMQSINASNDIMFKHAKNREAIQKYWEISLHKNEEYVRLVEDLRVDKKILFRGLVITNVFIKLFLESLLIGFFLFIDHCQQFYLPSDFLLLLKYIAAIFLFLIIMMIPSTLKSLWLLVKHGPTKSSLLQIGTVILKTFHYMGVIKTDLNTLQVSVDEIDDSVGDIYCHLEGGSNQEKWIFLQALQELFNPIDNPRYLLITEINLMLVKKIQYHAIPSKIGAHRRYVEQFTKLWHKYVCPANYIYTRNLRGRAILVKARNHSRLRGSRQKYAKRVTRWK